MISDYITIKTRPQHHVCCYSQENLEHTKNKRARTRQTKDDSKVYEMVKYRATYGSGRSSNLLSR